jgi:RimJ/RimL family protein N-acetyltransferase
VAPIEPPTITDGDLTLRPPEPADADAVTAACQDPDIQRWTFVPSPYRPEHAAGWIAGAPGEAAAGASVSLLAVEEGRVVGSFGLMEIDQQRGYGEIGYWVAAEARGRGLATRGTRLLHEWATGSLGLTKLEILPHEDNTASRKVAERAGYRDTGELRRQPRDTRGHGASYAVYAWEA